MSLASIPQQAPSAEALAAGRVVTLSNQASSRGVASYSATASALQAQAARQVAQVSASQPGVMTSTEKQYPAMPKIARKSPLLESMGAPGTAIFQGIITNDDYNPDFYWRDAVEIYDQMVRNDGQIMAIVQQLELPIRRATWTVEPFSARPGAAVSDRDKEVASFIETCLFHDLVRTTADGRRVYQKWDDILRHALMMLRYGFAAFEKVWRKEDGWVKLAHLMPMLPMSVYRWWVGRDNELVGIQQYTFKDYTYRFVDIPADKILLFTHRMEGQNYEGFSLLRAAYKHWYYKDQFYKIDAIGLERNAIAVPYIELPASFNESDVSQAQAILANLRANESMGVTLPFGWKIAYIPGSEHYAGAALKSIEHHDILIARAVLAQFINLGSGETGTYNLAVDQRQDLLESLQAEAEYIEDTFNADLIPQLCDFNFSGLEGYPRIKASKLAQADITELVDSISKLKAKDANFLTPDPELEDWIRDQMGMPKATRSIIAGENPTAPTTPQRPDATHEQTGDHSDAESAPVDGKKAPESQSADGSASGGGGDDDGGEAGVSGAAAQASERATVVTLADAAQQHSGVMVAFMLPPDVAQEVAWAGGEPANDLHITLAYLGDASDMTPRQLTKLQQIVGNFALNSGPVDIRLNGISEFTPTPSSGDKKPIYACVESDSLLMRRAELVKTLEAAGLPVDETFTIYKPHVTLMYADPGAHVTPQRVPDVTFMAQRYTCAIGSQRIEFPIAADLSVPIGYHAGEAALASDLATDTKLLAESLAIIAGMDATERGLGSAERLDSMRLFNPNHDSHTGEFSSGDGGGAAGKSGKATAKRAKGSSASPKVRAAKGGAASGNAAPKTPSEREAARMVRQRAKEVTTAKTRMDAAEQALHGTNATRHAAEMNRTFAARDAAKNDLYEHEALKSAAKAPKTYERMLAAKGPMEEARADYAAKKAVADQAEARHDALLQQYKGEVDLTQYGAHDQLEKAHPDFKAATKEMNDAKSAEYKAHLAMWRKEGVYNGARETLAGGRVTEEAIQNHPLMQRATEEYHAAIKANEDAHVKRSQSEKEYNKAVAAHGLAIDRLDASTLASRTDPYSVSERGILSAHQDVLDAERSGDKGALKAARANYEQLRADAAQKGLIDANSRYGQPTARAIKAVETFRAENLDKINAQKANPVTLDEMKRQGDADAKRLVEGTHTFVAIDPENLGNVLDSGRFKSQFEPDTTGTFGMSSKHNALRAQVEKDLGGYPPGVRGKTSVAPEIRPIYGYMARDEHGITGGDVVHSYGSALVRLNDSTRGRTTFMVGDSFEAHDLMTGAGHKGQSSAWSRAMEPRWYAVPGHYNDIGPYWTKEGVHGFAYLEAQVHGGVHASDIHSVTFRDPSAPPSKALTSRLDKAGIPWTYEPMANLDEFRS